jgi:hypothetical protein
MKRTFLPIKDYPVYNDYVDKFLTQSKIFNGGSQMSTSRKEFFDKKGTEQLIIELEGLDDGKYRRNGEVILALIPQQKALIGKIQMDFERYKINRINQGYSEPDQMPKEMLDSYYAAEAKLTVLIAEAEEAHKRLTELLKDDPREIDEEKILQFGLRCFTKMHDGIVYKIDGQHVSQLDSGLLVVDDPRSIYDGIDLPSYRKLAREWQLQLQENDRKKLLRLQSEAKAEGKQIPQALPVKSMHRTSINSLPKFPSWAKNHKEIITYDSTSLSK